MPTSWLDLLSAGIAGGVATTLLDQLLGWLKRLSERSESAEALVTRHLDPILKATDELVAKLRWLAVDDFRSLSGRTNNQELTRAEINKLSVLYLFGQLWCRIQILRIEGVFMDLSAKTEGERLLSFVRTLESSRTRLLDRAWQRGIGEALICNENGHLQAMSFFRFVQRFRSDGYLHEWFRPLTDLLDRSGHTRHRQRILVYGAILHAMVDTLDPSHRVTQQRPGWANKLTRRSRRDLEYRIFRVYLPFVSDQQRYTGKPNNRAQRHTSAGRNRMKKDKAPARF